MRTRKQYAIVRDWEGTIVTILPYVDGDNGGVVNDNIIRTEDGIAITSEAGVNLYVES